MTRQESNWESVLTTRPRRPSYTHATNPQTNRDRLPVGIVVTPPPRRHLILRNAGWMVGANPLAQSAKTTWQGRRA